MPRPSRALRHLISLSRELDLDPEDISERTKLLLNTYAEFRWSTTLWEKDITDRLSAFAPGDTDSGLLWLDTFAPAPTRRKTADAKRQIRHNQFLLHLLEEAVKKTAHYPTHGKTYHKILTNYYIEAKQLKDHQIMQALHLDRSTYYSRKKESILCCALHLFAPWKRDPREW